MTDLFRRRFQIYTTTPAGDGQEHNVDIGAVNKPMLSALLLGGYFGLAWHAGGKVTVQYSVIYGTPARLATYGREVETTQTSAKASDRGWRASAGAIFVCGVIGRSGGWHIQLAYDRASLPACWRRLQTATDLVYERHFGIDLATSF